MYAVVVAQSVGPKLWPVTSEAIPKAMMPVYSDNTMLEETIMRIIPFLESPSHLFLALPAACRETLRKQETLKVFSIPEKNLLNLPSDKGSAWAILAACQRIKNKKELLIVTPSDQFFWPREAILWHLNNTVLGAAQYPDYLTMLCLPPGGPTPLLNYVNCNLKDSFPVGNSFNMEMVEEDSISNTLLTGAAGYKVKPDYTTATELVAQGWVWDLSTFIGSVSLITKSITEHSAITKQFSKTKIEKYAGWDELPDISFESDLVPTMVKNNKAKAAIIPGIKWSTLDNWVSIQHLLYQAGLFVARPVEGLHLVDSTNNLVFKPPGKDVALFGINDLIIIDTGEKLLIGTAGGLYENF